MSTDTVLHDTFTKERRHFRRSRKHADQLGESPLAPSPAITSDIPAYLRRTPYRFRFIDNILWMLEYNQDGPLHLVIALGHIHLILYLLINSILFSTLTTELDPITKAYKDPWLNYLSSFLFADAFSSFPRSRVFNKFLALILTQYLILRLKSLHARYGTALSNRYQYHKINIVEMNVAYACALRTNLVGLIKLIRAREKSELEALTSKHESLMKDLTKGLRHLTKIDSQYYFNQIDFNYYYKGHSLLDKEESNEKRYAPIQKSSSFNDYFVTRVVLRTIKAFRYLFTLERNGKLLYIPKPAHRIHPSHLKVILAVYYLSAVLLAFIAATSLDAFWRAEVEFNRINSRNVSTYDMLLNTRRQMRMICGLCLLFVLGVNSLECGLMVLSSLICHSRTVKIIKRLHKLIELQRAYARDFCRFIDWHNVHLADLDLHKLYKKVEERYRFEVGDDDDDVGVDLDGHSLNVRREIKIDENFGPLSKRLEYYRSNEHLLPRWTLLSTKSTFRSRTNVRTHVRDAVASYKLQMNGVLDKLNKEVEYILDLVVLLTGELNDLKAYFTTYLNVSLLFCIAGYSLAIVLVFGSNNYHEFILPCNACIATLLPVIYAMFLGATTERAFRRICQKVITLSVNQLDFIDRQLVLRMQQICTHLAGTDNRSFIILGNFPLSFGSLTSILGWIATGNLLLQRFFD